MEWTFKDPKGRPLTVSADTDTPPSEAELDQLFAQKYGNDTNMAKEVGKGLVRSYDNLAAGVGASIKWMGDNIENDKALTYKDPFGRQQKIEVRKSDLHKKIGTKVSRFGQGIYDYWSNRADNGFEAPDPEVFKGDFMENPSWTRAAAYVAEGVPSLGFAAAISIATKNPTIGALTLGLQQGSEDYMGARKAGKDVRESNLIGGLSTLGNTVLEGMPIHAFLKGTERTTKGVVGKLIGKVFKDSAKISIPKEAFYGMVVEGSEEVAQQFWSNLVAKVGYDNTRKLTAGMIESFIGGAGSGGIIGGFNARGLQNQIKSLKKEGLTDSDVSTMMDHLSNQMVASADKIEPELEKRLDLFQNRAITVENAQKEFPGLDITDEVPKYLDRPSFGMNLPKSEVRRVPVGQIADEHKYQVEGRGLNRQVVDDIKKKIQDSGPEIPVNITKPVLLNKEGDKFYILGGHHRISAFKELGFPEVDAVVVNVSPEIAKELAKKDNIQFNDPPTVQGLNFRRAMESGQKMPDIIYEYFGPVNETSKKWFNQTVNSSYLPGPTRSLIDNGTIPLEVGSVVGEKIKTNGLDMSPDTVMALFQKFHIEQGLSASALNKVLDTVLSVAKSKTNTKERQLDMFGKMLNTPDVMSAAVELERIRNQAQSTKRSMDSLIKKSTKDKVSLKPETVTDLKDQVKVMEAKVKELNEKLYKFKLDDFIGPVQHVLKQDEKGEATDAVEGFVEPGTAGTPEIPTFKSSTEAIAFGKFHRMNKDVLKVMTQMVANLQDPIMESSKKGTAEGLQEGLNLATRSQFLKEALKAAEGAFDQPQSVIPRYAGALQAKKEQQLELDIKPNEEKNITEDALKTGDIEKVQTILKSQEPVTKKDYESLRQHSLLKRAADLKRKQEAKQNVISSQDREVNVYNFEAALKLYEIDKNELALMIKKWLPVFGHKYHINTNDYLSYAWEGAMKAMGAESQIQPDKTEKITTSYDPNREVKKKSKNPTEKFFNYAKDYMNKWIVRYGLPTEKRTISVPDYNVTEAMGKFMALMEAVSSYDEAKERWGEFMYSVDKNDSEKRNPMPFSEKIFSRFLDAYNAGTVSLDAPLHGEGDEDFSLMDVYDEGKDIMELDDKDLSPYAFEQKTEQEQMDEINDAIKKAGPVNALKNALAKLSATERDVVSLAFGLIGSEYGVQRGTQEISEILNGSLQSDRSDAVKSFDMFGQLSKETTGNKALNWTPKKVERVLLDAFKKIGSDMDLIQLIEEARRRKDFAGPNESGDINNESGQGFVPDTPDPKTLDRLVGGILGNEGGFLATPSIELNPLLKAEYAAKVKDTEFAFSTPYWYARKYPLARAVFQPILKQSVYGYNKYASIIQSIMNNFQDVNMLGSKRANEVSEILYKNAGKDEWRRARKLKQEVQWYTPDQLRENFHFDEEQIKVYQQFVRLVKFEVALLKRQYRLSNDYYEKRKITIDDGGVTFPSEETDEQFQMRKAKIDATIAQKFPDVYIPINRYGNVWVIAKKFSHNDKHGRPVYDEEYHLVDSPTHIGALFQKEGKEVKALREKLEADGWKVEVNAKSYLASEKVWGRMDLFELERLMEYAGLNWQRAEYRINPDGERQPLNDLAKLQDFVDKVRASKGGIYGNFLRRDWKAGYRTDAEHLKKSLINFGEGAARFLARYEGHKQAEEALKQIPHDEKASRDMQQLHKNMTNWLNTYKTADTGTWSGFRSSFYMFFLAGKLSFFVQNLTQPMFTTYFRLGREMVGPQAEQVFLKSYKDTMAYILYQKGKIKESGLDKELISALGRAQKQEIISGTFTDMLLATKSIESQEKGWSFIENFTRNADFRSHWLGILGTASEKLNRTHAFVVGWEVGKRKGLMGETLFDFAADYVNGTQWAYGSHNLPYAMTSLPPKIRAAVQTILLFQTHTWNWFQFSLQEVKDAVAKTPDGKREYERLVGLMGRMFVSFFLWTGTTGLPLYSLLNWVQKFATKKHFHQHLRNFLQVQFPGASKETLDALNRIITNGYLSHVTDTDFGRQLGFGNAVNVEYAKNADEFLLGAAYTKMKAIATYAIPTLIEGIKYKNTDQILRAGEVASPTAIGQGIFRGQRLERDQAFRIRSGEKIADLKEGDVTKTRFGFTPLHVTEAFYEREAKQNLAEDYEAKRAMFTRQVVDARNRKDYKRLKELNKEIRQYNMENPNAKIHVSKQAMRAGKRRFGKGSDIRKFPKAVRKEVRKIERTY